MGQPLATDVHSGEAGWTNTLALRLSKAEKTGSRDLSPKYVPLALVYSPTPTNPRVSRQNYDFKVRFDQVDMIYLGVEGYLQLLDGLVNVREREKAEGSKSSWVSLSVVMKQEVDSAG